MKTWKFGEVWIILRLQTWGTVIPGVVAVTREKNHHCDSMADPTRRHWRIGRCDGSSRGWRPGNSDGSDGCCEGPSRWWPSRWRVSRWRISRGPVMVTDHEPEIVDDSAEVADPAHHQEPAGDGPAHDDDDPAGVAGPAHHQESAGDGPARIDEPVAHGTPAGNTPAAGQDSSMFLDVSSLLFPSLPRAINQTTLIDFMSMWTLMQRRMDPGMAVPYAQARPAAQTTAPMPRDDDTPPRKYKTPPRTPDRWPRTPVRRSRTPVRRARVMDESKDSTRSRSPIRRSSLSESSPRDASPVNFLAALDSEDKVKDRSLLMMAVRRRSRQPSTSCFVRLSRLSKVPSRSIPSRHAECSGRHLWISATVKSRTGSHG